MNKISDKCSWRIALAVFAASLLSGCASNVMPLTSPAISPVNLDFNVRSGELVPKVETFMMVLDATSSMSIPYNLPIFESSSKFIVEKQIATLFANTMPQNDNIASQLISFGNGACHGWKSTTVNLPMSPFSQSALSEAIASIPCASSGTPIHKGLLAAEDDIRSARGPVAIILIGDGLSTDEDMDDILEYDPVIYVHAMKAEFGDKLCINTVWVGNDLTGKAVMSAIADASVCGIAVAGSQVADAGGMSGFIADVLFKQGPPLDSDNDRIPDSKDKCSGTPESIAVDPDGCPLDSDGDDLLDYQDKCPNTPKGAIVNSQGCWSLRNVTFDFNSDTIRADAYPELYDILTILRKHPNIQVTLECHTDNIGSELYNLGLSQRRAKAIMDYLLSKNIAADRLSSVGYGEIRPIESNETEFGNSANRRVDLNIINR